MSALEVTVPVDLGAELDRTGTEQVGLVPHRRVRLPADPVGARAQLGRELLGARQPHGRRAERRALGHAGDERVVRAAQAPKVDARADVVRDVLDQQHGMRPDLPQALEDALHAAGSSKRSERL